MLPPRWGHVAAYDAKRDQMLVFGGEADGTKLNDLWALDLGSEAWHRIDSPDGPGERSDLAGVLDTTRDRLVLIGGRVGLATSIDEVWAYDLSSNRWSELERGPPARHDVPGATDGARAWIFGGAGALFQSLDDLWQLDFATDSWVQLPDDGTRPTARGSSALTYSEGALYLVGGHDVSSVMRDVWRYDLTKQRWQQLSPSRDPIAGAHYGYALDKTCDTLFLSGGDNLDNYDVAFTEGLALGDRPRYARLLASSLPPPRDHASLIVDSKRRDLVLVGGGSLGDGLGLLNDAWIFPLPGGCP
jgi:N-acetylneuraminic acid mutarotase